MSDKHCKTGDRQSWPVQLPENKLQHTSVGSVTVKILHKNKEMINQEMNKVISARNGPGTTFVTWRKRNSKMLL